MFFLKNDSLNNLGRGSPKEHFCQMILKSFQWFLTRRFLKFFLWFALTSRILHGLQSLNNFQSVSPKDQSCEIRLNLAQWFRRRCCLNKLWMDERTTTMLTVSDHNSSSCAFGSGELKRHGFSIKSF